MKFATKILCLVLLVLLAGQVIDEDTNVGRVVAAAVGDAAEFCTRQPIACAEGAEVAANTRQLVVDAIGRLAAAAETTSLSAADRAIQVPTTTITPDAAAAKGDPLAEALAVHESIAANNQP